MSAPDNGTLSLTASGVTAGTTATGGAMGWVSENGLIIGLTLSVISLIVGIVFKVINGRRAERHHEELLKLEKLKGEQLQEAMLAEMRKTLNVSVDES